MLQNTALITYLILFSQIPITENLISRNKERIYQRIAEVFLKNKLFSIQKEESKNY